MENRTENGEPVQPRLSPLNENGMARQSRANEVDLAWLAGIIDGEGYIGAQLTGPGPIKSDFAINNCSMVLLNDVQRIVQEVTAKKYSIHRCSDKKGRNFVFYSFRVSDQNGIWLVCRAVLPYLRTKKPQALAMVEFCESRMLNRHKREGYTAWEQSIVSRLKALKRAGYTPHPRSVETERAAPTVQA